MMLYMGAGGPRRRRSFSFSPQLRGETEKHKTAPSGGKPEYLNKRWTHTSQTKSMSN